MDVEKLKLKKCQNSRTVLRTKMAVLFLKTKAATKNQNGRQEVEIKNVKIRHGCKEPNWIRSAGRGLWQWRRTRAGDPSDGALPTRHATGGFVWRECWVREI